MLRSLTAEQFLGWMAFSRVEHFGELRADFRAASIVEALWNVNRDPKKRSEPYTIMDTFGHFLRGLEELDLPKAPPQTWQEKKSILMLMLRAATKK